MKHTSTRLAVYLAATVICYYVAVTVGNQAGLMAAIAIGLVAEMCFWREVFLRWSRVPEAPEATDPRPLSSPPVARV